MNFLQLPEHWVSGLGRYSIGTKSKIRGHHKGSSRSRRFGSSMDFSDFREYHPGDDVRHIDWNVFARTERVYIKRFLDEQEMRVHIMVDGSKSMKGKWLFTKQLAFSLGSIVLLNDDKLTLSIGQGTNPPLKRKGKSAQKLFNHFIMSLPVADEKRFAEVADFQPAQGSTVLFVLSDALETLDEWQRFFSRAVKYSKDVRFMHVSDQQERQPLFAGDLRLIDDESSDAFNVTMSSQTAENYNRKRLEHIDGLQALCRRYGVQYMPVHVEDGIQHVFLHQLLKQKWIR
ncbi:DUF58 domain-containing protein [Planococcus halotolerans]|uniref:DUF58 domain-containing protein n=1 Tax=Planococcus halotolerans TaxID=2233542 RepID=A0A365L230_9BACL|nr:DUF58 domain-containing protein [Planococcus halotolerans]QHJ70816.1 DUF58 domain-containing protein [Planococcus halotolerans]RAZ79427.1 DUF58 domain-containing protein [Planococcus halotolerans]